MHVSRKGLLPSLERVVLGGHLPRQARERSKLQDPSHKSLLRQSAIPSKVTKGRSPLPLKNMAVEEDDVFGSFVM